MPVMPLCPGAEFAALVGVVVLGARLVRELFGGPR